MRVAILDDYQRATPTLRALDRLAGHEVVVDEGTGSPALDDVDAVVLIRERTRVDAAFLDRAPRLRLVAQTGRLGPHVDVDACTRRGVAVVEGVGSPVAPAELTWALVLAARRRVVDYARAARAGVWQDVGDARLGEGLAGKVLGVWGYGRVGRRVARYGRAFEMRVVIHGRPGSLATAEAEGLEVEPDRRRFFARCDVLTVHLRLVDATRGAIDAEALDAMRPEALFVNTSRAELVAPGALEGALARRRPGFAALDVLRDEPVRTSDHPLLGHPRVLVTPHVGFVERDTYELYFGATLDHVRAFAEGHPTGVVNPEVFARER
jgi:D-3-phosphoglycerate dehydrogenase